MNNTQISGVESNGSSKYSLIDENQVDENNQILKSTQYSPFQKIEDESLCLSEEKQMPRWPDYVDSKTDNDPMFDQMYDYSITRMGSFENSSMSKHVLIVILIILLILVFVWKYKFEKK